MKRAVQVGILAACADRLRPMRERNVFESGTKGVGGGIWAVVVDERWRWRRGEGRRKGRNEDGWVRGLAV